MSKSPVTRRNRRPGKRLNIRGQSEKSLELIKIHNKIMAGVTDFYGEKTVKTLGLLIGGAFNQLYINAFNGARLCDYDNYLLNTYNSLTQSYKNILGFYHEFSSEIVSDESKQILHGMITVIQTRLNEYYDIDINSCYDGKIDIANGFLLDFVEKTEAVVKSGLSRLIHNTNDLCLHDEWNISVDLWAKQYEQIKAIVLEDFAKPIFEVYVKCLNATHRVMDNASYGTQLTSCYELIKQEMEILGAIIKIQTPELEKQPDDIAIIQKILFMAREAYQKLGRDMEHIHYLYRLAEEKPAVTTYFYNDFLESMMIVLEKDNDFVGDINDFITVYESQTHLFISKLNDSMHVGIKKKLNVFDENTVGNMAARIKKDSLNLSKKIGSNFSEILDFTNENGEKFNGIQEQQIINGIFETITIKIQSIQEYSQEFETEISPHTQHKIQINELVNDDHIEAACEKIFALWKTTFFGFVELSRDSVKAVNAFIRNESQSISEEMIDTFNKKIAVMEEKILKLDIRFKRECLLFEISTFEEILSYSIAKLKESDNKNVLEYTETVDRVNNNIHDILHGYKIDRIYPNPHDMFNGKEHEVLMARETDGFEKGEIVKMINSGYRQNGNVIIRANVIAAK